MDDDREIVSLADEKVIAKMNSKPLGLNTQDYTRLIQTKFKHE